MLGNTSVDPVYPLSVYPPVISRTLSPGKRNLLSEEQQLFLSSAPAIENMIKTGHSLGNMFDIKTGTDVPIVRFTSSGSFL